MENVSFVLLNQLSSVGHFFHDTDDCLKKKISTVVVYSRLFENTGKALTVKCPKNDKNPHDCDRPL